MLKTDSCSVDLEDAAVVYDVLQMMSMDGCQKRCCDFVHLVEAELVEIHPVVVDLNK